MPKSKSVEDYLLVEERDATSLAAYLTCPAGAFLKYVCDAYDAFRYCELRFTKKNDGSYNKDSKESLNHISCSLLATVMGHFETYQKSLLAGLIDWSINIDAFKFDDFRKSISRSGSLDFEVDLSRMLAQRGSPAHVGYVIADSMGGWHNPSKVNAYFQGLGIKANALSNEQVADLRVLWQIRHSIVHTGAYITAADSQKVERLSEWSDCPIIFNHFFYNWFSRKMHRITQDVNNRLHAACNAGLKASATQGAKDSLTRFLKVSSPKQVWL